MKIAGKLLELAGNVARGDGQGSAAVIIQEVGEARGAIGEHSRSGVWWSATLSGAAA